MRSHSAVRVPQPDPKKKILLFSNREDEGTRSPEKFGKHVQVGNNFLIVYPSDKYPAREVIFGDSDYLSNIKQGNESNSSRCTSGVVFTKQLGRNAPVMSKSVKMKENQLTNLHRRARPETAMLNISSIRGSQMKSHERIKSAG